MNAVATSNASLGKRIGGGLIDLVVSVALAVIFGLMFGYGGVGEDGVNVSYDGGPTLVVALAIFLIFALMEWKLGKTPGKMVVKTRVVSAGGAPVGFGAALARNLMRFIDGLFLYLVGIIVIAADGENRRLGDMVGGTRVVND